MVRPWLLSQLSYVLLHQRWVLFAAQVINPPPHGLLQPRLQPRPSTGLWGRWFTLQMLLYSLGAGAERQEGPGFSPFLPKFTTGEQFGTPVLPPHGAARDVFCFCIFSVTLPAVTCTGGRVRQPPHICKPVALTVATDQCKHRSCLEHRLPVLPPHLSRFTPLAQRSGTRTTTAHRYANEVFTTTPLTLALAQAAKSPMGPVP